MKELKKSLTRRQKDIIVGLELGLTYEEIGIRLFVSERTVRREVFRMKELFEATTLPVLLSRI